MAPQGVLTTFDLKRYSFQLHFKILCQLCGHHKVYTSSLQGTPYTCILRTRAYCELHEHTLNQCISVAVSKGEAVRASPSIVSEFFFQ